MARVTIKGRESLKRKLAALPKEAKTAIRAAMEKQADLIVAMAQRFVPVDTGTLRNSIGWTWGRAPQGASVIGSVETTGGELSLTIFAGSEAAYYARWVEHGTARTPAQPFFFVSYRANRKKAKSAIRYAVRKSAKAVAARGG